MLGNAEHPTPFSDASPDRLIAWHDGIILPAADFHVSPGDAGFVLGATVTEQLRTFRGRLFLANEHARRLATSLSLIGLAPAIPIADLMTAAAEVAAHNHRILIGDQPADIADLGVVVFITPGLLSAQHQGQEQRPLASVHTFPLAFSLWSQGYTEGIRLRGVGVQQVPEACWPIRAKVRSRLHYYLADREAAAVEAGARAVLYHADGRVSETSTANIAIVRDGAIATPPPSDALAGVSLGHLKGLATAAGITWIERSLTRDDLAAADEILLTSTPFCLLPATSFDGVAVGTGSPGVVFGRLLKAWSQDVDLDIADQARASAVASRPKPSTS